jgi:hypothetical protein
MPSAAVESLIREASAQLTIAKTMANLPDDESRRRVITTVRLLIEADQLMPGILAGVAAGLPSRKTTSEI